MEAFQAAHGIEELVIVAGAGMLSATNLTALDEARLRFIVGACTTRTPGDLKTHFHWAGGTFTDGQLINTIIPGKNSRSERDVRKRHESGQGDERVLHAPSRAVQHGRRSGRGPQMSSARALRTMARRWVATLSS